MLTYILSFVLFWFFLFITCLAARVSIYYMASYMSGQDYANPES